MSNSFLFIVPAEHRDTLNAILNMCGYGPDNISVGASPNGQAPWAYYYGNWEDMPAEAEAVWRGLRDALPELGPDAAWGEDGLPSEEDALAAVASFELLLRDGPNMTAQQHRDGVLHGLGVKPFSLD
jgi:predicted dehydrogenase